ncbi:MAG: tripartite tricarboxylate transporter TctB family protein [Burkholderiales bacterium]|nr:tripartite tricarboxylate transporter TctB family protein [Burkholderiales bacterium]
MEDKQGSGDVVHSGISVRAAEIVVAVILLGLGGLVVYDSVRLGFRWVGDGPEAGYFPFYIGLFICIASLITLGQVLFGKTRGDHQVFVAWEQLKLVLSVLVPAAFFVLGIQLVGIYLAAAAYIAFFMVWLGKYNWIKSVLLGIAVSIVTFMMFEIWFKVPLFKGEFNPLSIIGY